MKINKTTVIVAIATIAFIVLAYFLWKLLVYIIIAAVISLILNPINLKFKKFHIKKFYFPPFLRASLLLLLFWSVVFGVIYAFFPLVINEIYRLASISPSILTTKMAIPLKSVQNTLNSLGMLTYSDTNITQLFVNKFLTNFNAANIQDFLENIIGLFSNIVVAILIVTFLAFFFLKDEKLFMKIVLMFVPVSFHSEVKHVLISISKMLMRYFSGVVLDLIIIFILVSIGMGITGCNLNTCIMLGIVASLFNLIPYVGPLISFLTGMTVCFLTYINADFSAVILPHMLYMAIVYITVNILDASLIQPQIYSNAIKAHPLEIFIVILASGMLAGVIGMILAIPSYMMLRIIAKEFFYQFYLVKNLTKNI